MSEPTLPPDIIAALDRAAADDATVERLARHLEPKLWDLIDQHNDDDDWNGATALNARITSMQKARDVLASFKEQP